MIILKLFRVMIENILKMIKIKFNLEKQNIYSI